MAKFVGKIFCKIAEGNDIDRLASFKDEENVVYQKDIPYAEGGVPQRLLNIYKPKDAEGKLPVIIDIHGGGWWYGDKELNRFYDQWLASQGFAVVGFSYRLAPHATFNMQVEDVFALFNKVIELADKQGFDLNNAFLTGDSAGGHLASVAINILHNPKLKELFGVDSKISFRAVNFTCGALYPSSMMVAPMGLFFRDVLGKGYKKSPYFKAFDFDSSTPCPMVPCTLISGSKDFLRNMTKRAFAELQEKGADCEMYFTEKCEDENYRPEHVYNILYPKNKEALDVNGKMIAFFKKHMV